MKNSKHLIPAILAGALSAAFAMNVSAQAPAAPAAAKPAAPAAKAPAPTAQRTFASPEEAAKALADAVRAADVNALLAVVGPNSKSWLFTGDSVADRNDWKTFLAAYDAKNAFERKGEATAILTVGKDDWPFPAPLVKKGAQWSFDADAGREEILNRRVGRNELDTMQTLLAIVDAQREYAATDPDKNGYADYARRFRSTAGKKDGLYWPDEVGGKLSPLGPLVATASLEGYGKNPPKADEKIPYHGYYYRILTSQGKDAPGGAYDYLVGDKLLGGFGVVAYPSSYGSSGVVTFVVNHDGVVYEKDLGAQTAGIGAAMTRFNPDATWRKAQ